MRIDASLVLGIAVGAVGALALKALGITRSISRRSGTQRVNPGFKPVPQLESGKYKVCDLDLCRLYIMDDANYPCWAVLVPRIDGVEELTDLTAEEQELLWNETLAVTKALQELYKPDKMNVAAIGNIVRQLHVHIKARMVDDPSWPGPCYGAVPAKPLDQVQAQELLENIRIALHSSSRT